MRLPGSGGAFRLELACREKFGVVDRREAINLKLVDLIDAIRRAAGTGSTVWQQGPRNEHLVVVGRCPDPGLVGNEHPILTGAEVRIGPERPRSKQLGFIADDDRIGRRARPVAAADATVGEQRMTLLLDLAIRKELASKEKTRVIADRSRI